MRTGSSCHHPGQRWWYSGRIDSLWLFGKDGRPRNPPSPVARAPSQNNPAAAGQEHYFHLAGPLLTLALVKATVVGQGEGEFGGGSGSLARASQGAYHLLAVHTTQR